ncbi:MAG: thioesterase family protein [Patescibacteria group bacterium]|jgi:acyl-CoA thioesterase FadM
MNLFEIRETVTESLATSNGWMAHSSYAILMGKARELMAVELWPGFKENAALMISRQKNTDNGFTLLTHKAVYRMIKPFFVDDEVIVSLNVSSVNHLSFTLFAEFINSVNQEVCATGTMSIVYASLDGRPRRLPEDIREILLSVCVPTEKKDLFETTKEVNGDHNVVFELKETITFHLTNAEGTLTHTQYPVLLSKAAEMMFVKKWSDFRQDAKRFGEGRTDFGISTLFARRTSYVYKKPFYFADEVLVKIRVVDSNSSTITIFVEFTNHTTGDVHADGVMEIVYANSNGELAEIPSALILAIS